MKKCYNKMVPFLSLLLILAAGSFTSVIAQPLNGVYTVGGTSPNYTTLTTAVSELNSKGVSGPVTFRVRTGSYTGQYIINNIAGASAVNRIIFESETGNAANVTLTFAGTSTTNNYVFRLNNSRYITIRNMTLNNTGATYGAGIDFVGTSSFDSVYKCVLQGSTTTTTSQYKARIYAYDHTGSNNVISDNTFKNGSAAVYWRGVSTASTSNGNVIANNTISDPYYYGVYSYYTRSLQIVNNNITRTGTGTFYGLYCYYGFDDFKFDGNIYTGAGITGTNYPLYIYYCDGTSAKRGSISGNTFVVNSSTSIYNYIYYGDYYSVNNNTVDFKSTTGTVYPLYNYETNGNGEQVYIENNDLKGETTTGTVYVFAHYYGNGCKFNNNNVTMNNTTGTTYVYGLYYSDAGEFKNNVINRNSSGSLYSYLGYYSDGNSVLDNNIIRNTTTGSALCYNYMGYYCDGVTITNNDIECKSGGSTIYGLYTYFYNLNSPIVIKNNKVVAINTTGITYGLYNLYAPNGEIANNSVYTKTSGSNYSFYGGYYTGGTKVYNNSIHSDGTGTTNYTFYCYNNASNQYASIYNNVISRSGSTGYLFYYYNPDYYEMDYNNFYSAAGGNYFYSPYLGVIYGNLTAWRAAHGFDKNSLSYNPGFTNLSQGDLRPNAANANSWSLNGRGVHIAGNDKDINGTARALTTAAGVPDIGAYEFTPTATPPVCAAAPAAPVAGGTQTFTFGEDTVAVIKWGATVPTGLALRQYTGTNPPGFLSYNPTQMFYYLDVAGNGSSLGYNLNMYYKEPWMGTIASEKALRLAEKVGAGNWSSYPYAVSSSNITRNFINTTGVPSVGALFTGIDVENNAGVDAIVDPKPPFCAGTYPVSVRIENNGSNIINNVKVSWELDGIFQGTIAHTTPINIGGSTQGNTAVISLGNVAFTGGGRKIKVWTHEPNGVADPNPNDDTIDVVHRSALNGTYTVGGANPNFPTLIDAVNAIDMFGTCGNVIFSVRPGNYVGQVRLREIISASNTPDRVTFQAENGNAATTGISYSALGQGNRGVILMDKASRYTFRNMGITAIDANYGCAIEFITSGSANDSFINCNLTVPNTATSSYNNYVFNSSATACNDNVFTGCKMTGAYYGIYWYPSSSPYTTGLVINNCDIDTRYMAIYTDYVNGPTYTNNRLTAMNNTCYYGISTYEYYRSSSDVTTITGNKIVGFYGVGVDLYYPGGNSTNRAKIMNNAVIMNSVQASYYPLYTYYPTYVDFVNNTFINNGPASTSYYGAYMYMGSTAYVNNNIYNNIFANLSGGVAAYVYTANGTVSNMDYNNLYSISTSAFMSGNSTASSLAAWRSATGFDKNSVTYEPSFMSNTNPAPDVNNPAVWALNGHALQIDGNTADINGKPRIDKRENGVPDIGAYEVDPIVLPPLATATPTQDGQGVTQVFTFAGNEVATVKWDANFPLTAPLEVRQYSGVKGPDIAAQAAPNGSMYFYTDIKQKGASTTYRFDADVNYMDIWLGTIASEGDLKMAFKFKDSNPWRVYNGNMSSVNALTNVLTVPNAHHFGYFTGLEDGSIISAFVEPLDGVVICTGNSTQLSAEPKTGNSYQWKRNGTDIAGANGTNLTVSQPGDYSIVITFITPNGTKIVESVPITISTIAPPNAIVTANGPLTYCTGGNLMLDAGSAQGVTYQWQLGGNDIPGATGATYNVNQPGNYTVVATNIGCSSTSTATVINNGPLVVDLGRDTSFCEQPSIYAKLDAGYPGSKYVWNTGDTSRTIEVKQGGSYWVEVDGGPNCIDRDTINVTISPLPSANGISYVKNGNAYQFSPSGAQNETGYLWLFSDGTQSTQKIATKTVDGQLYVRLVLFNACGSDTVQIGWPLNVEEVVAEGQVKVYPNPAKDKVTINVEGLILEEVEILNAVGGVIYRAVADKGSNSHSIDISGYANGHYMLRAKTSGGMITKAFDVIK